MYILCVYVHNSIDQLGFLLKKKDFLYFLKKIPVAIE